MTKGRAALRSESDAGKENCRFLHFASLGRKTFPRKVRGTADPSAPVGMTKGSAALRSESDAGKENCRFLHFATLRSG
jgi:hypothetical protein